MKLWTVSQDYGGTGEGRTLMARIAHAQSAEDALAGFGQEFDSYFSVGAEALEGVQRNAVTQALFTETALERVKQMEGHATVELAARLHFNFA